MGLSWQWRKEWQDTGRRYQQRYRVPGGEGQGMNEGTAAAGGRGVQG
jgi:hypothetical protein